MWAFFLCGCIKKHAPPIIRFGQSGFSPRAIVHFIHHAVNTVVKQCKNMVWSVGCLNQPDEFCAATRGQKAVLIFPKQTIQINQKFQSLCFGFFLHVQS